MSKTTPNPSTLAHLIDPAVRDYVDAKVAQLHKSVSSELVVLQDGLSLAHQIIQKHRGEITARQNQVEDLLRMSKTRVDRLRGLIELAEREGHL